MGNCIIAETRCNVCCGLQLNKNQYTKKSHILRAKLIMHSIGLLRSLTSTTQRVANQSKHIRTNTLPKHLQRHLLHMKLSNVQHAHNLDRKLKMLIHISHSRAFLNTTCACFFTRINQYLHIHQWQLHIN